MPVKVSVVVPVYNPGEHIHGLVASLRRQSLPPDEFEVVFVDDGSTDGTEALLDRLDAELPNMRVIHIPNSGWPGKPRNVGLDAAVGEYVQFVDNDDELGDEALERLHRFATENGSDVVIGKEVRRNVRRHVVALFNQNRPKAELGRDPILSYLTPHKMFRREFLHEHGLRFPEGRRRLEDHPFVVRAYFCADVISVLSDYACYYWIQRSDRTNAGLTPREWADWYGHMRDVLDVVADHTEPGPFRDLLLSHWYRTKGLRLIGPSFDKRPPDDARALFSALYELMQERFPPSVDDHVPGVLKVTSHLLRARDQDTVVALAAAQRGMTLEQTLDRAEWDGDALVVTATARLLYADGTPVELDERYGHVWWRPPLPLDDAVPAELLDFGKVPANPVEIAVRHRQTHELHALPGSTEPLPAHADGRRHVGATRTVRLDAATAAMGGPLPPGVWDLDLQLYSHGWGVRDLLRDPASAAGTALPLATSTAGIVSPYVTANNTLAVDVGQRTRSLLKVAVPDRGAAVLRQTGSAAVLDLPLGGVRVHGEPIPAELVLRLPGGHDADLRVPAGIAAAASGEVAVLRATLPSATDLQTASAGTGRLRLAARVAGRTVPLGVELAVREGQPPALRDVSAGRSREPAAGGLAARVRAAVPSPVRSALRRARRRAGRG